MTAARVQVLVRPGCHLCDVVLATVEEVCRPLGVDVEVTSIVGDAELTERYAELIPVTFVDGRRHDYWRVDPARLHAALTTCEGSG